MSFFVGEVEKMLIIAIWGICPILIGKYNFTTEILHIQNKL